MKIKKFNLLVTSNDVNSFGKSFSINKFSIYGIILCFFIILFFAFLGGYYIFLNGNEIKEKFIVSDKSVLPNFNTIVIPNNKHKISPTSYITHNFSENHLGIDINGDNKTKIYAAMSGSVFYEGFDSLKGNVIIISHDNGYITKYMHNKQNLVKSGNKVNLNIPIAEMGNTGSLVKSEGIHLHFELWKDGQAVNPIKFIKNLELIDTLYSDNFSVK